jgi:hypothetical protein
MKFKNFFCCAKTVLQSGRIFDNPGGGTSTVISVTGNGNICYRRRKSKIYVKAVDLYGAYIEFNGKRCITNDLKEFNPGVFDLAGHSCNCTFFFLLLKEMGLCGDILGRGRRDSPFYVEILPICQDQNL